MIAWEPRNRAGTERSIFPTAVANRILVVIAVLAALGAAGYIFRGDIVDLFSPPPPPDVGAINLAVDSAFALLHPKDVSASRTDLGSCEIPRDRVTLPSDISLLRANLAITQTVEKAGGSIIYGIESTDRKRRWQTVTLGIAAGDSLIREVVLVGRPK